jgi:hypothetical protein
VSRRPKPDVLLEGDREEECDGDAGGKCMLMRRTERSRLARAMDFVMTVQSCRVVWSDRQLATGNEEVEVELVGLW